MLEMWKKGNYKKQCKSKSVDRGKGYEYALSTKEKTFTKYGGICTWIFQAYM